MYKDDIVQWLKISCHSCGSPISRKISTLANIPKSARLSEYIKMTRTNGKDQKCAECGVAHPFIIRDKNRQVTIWAEYHEGGALVRKTQLFNHMIADIFDRISNETVVLLGKTPASHPRKFIINVMRIAPNTIRPDLEKIGGGRSNNNDLTTLIKTMVEINNGLPIIIPDEVTEELEVNYTNLDMAYHELVKGTPGSSGKNKITTNTNRPPGSVASRMSQKSGRVRQNLMGSRCWVSARSVITCDPTLRVDEVGVPKEIAEEIQIPETVTVYNRDRLMVYFLNKRDRWPGCTKVLKKRTGVEHWVGSLDQYFVLEDGDVIMRDLIDGDDVIFNRQPSLLGPCMSCLRVVIVSGKSIRMNVSACILFNADFDGDEMNLFFPRSVQTRNEIATLANVGMNFMSSKNGEPNIGCFQDTLASVVEMTKNDIVVSKEHAMELFKSYPLPFTKPTYTGRELISMLLPPINFKTTGLFYNKAYAPYLKYKQDEVQVIIERGILKQGILDHKSVGQARNNSIFHTIHNEYGPTVALNTLFNIQQVVMEFMFNRGFTVGLDDITVSSDSLKKIQHSTSALIVEANRITDKLQKGEIISPIGVTVQQFYEQQQIEALRPGDDFIGPVLSSVNPDTNGLYKMIQMCKKGKMKNFQAITSSIGSQLINGSRAHMNFGYRRTLPYFTRYDTHPISNGFVPYSYMTGIKPDAYIFTAQEARFGVINKSLSTSITGHQNRESVKNLESNQVNNLRQTTKHRDITQFLYGGSGVDVKRLESVSIPHVMLSSKEFDARYHSKTKDFDAKFRNAKVQKMFDDEFALLTLDRDAYRQIFLAIEASRPNHGFSNKVHLSVNVHRIITNALYDFRDIKRGPIDPVQTSKDIKAFTHSLPYIYINSIQERNQSRIPDKYIQACAMPIMLIRCYLNTSFIQKNRISTEMMKIIMDNIKYTMRKALIDYGTPVGALAAQSLSEPFTQHIIDSHHRSGISGSEGDSQTDKLTRNKELMHAKVSEAMKNPAMTLPVLPEYEGDKIKVIEIANHIENMATQRFVNDYRIFFESYKKPIHPDFVSDIKMIEQFEKQNPRIVVPNDLVKWVIRISISKIKMILKNMDLETIIFGLTKHFPRIFFVYSSESTDDVVIRCYIRNTQFKRGHEVSEIDIVRIADKIMDTVIRGVDGVSSAVVVNRNRGYVDADGSMKSKNVYMIKTIGTNLNQILENQYLDVNKCRTDSIREIEDMYGIEAARNMLRIELEMLIPGMSYTHYSVYADEMAITGRITPISRPGLDKREPKNVLLRTSYNFMVQVLKSAAVNNKHNEVYGTSAPLMLGRTPYVGSLYNQICVDHKFVAANVESIDDLIEGL
jgi:DNA-directed RNA polymerase beta' subunit